MSDRPELVRSYRGRLRPRQTAARDHRRPARTRVGGGAAAAANAAPLALRIAARSAPAVGGLPQPVQAKRLRLAPGLPIRAWMLAVGLALAAAPARADRIGPLQPGMHAREVVALLGPPGDTLPQPTCPGTPESSLWDYATRGLMLLIEGGRDGRLTSVSSFGEQGPPWVGGAHGPRIAIGDEVTLVRAALPGRVEIDGPVVEFARAGLTLTVSLSGQDPNRVIRLELADRLPKIYEEGDPCGAPAAPEPEPD